MIACRVAAGGRGSSRGCAAPPSRSSARRRRGAFSAAVGWAGCDQRPATGNYPHMFAGAFLIALLAIALDLLLGLIAWLAARRTHPRTKGAPSYALAPT